MTDLLKRKTKLMLVTPYEYRHRAIIAEVKTWGLELREKGRRKRVSISWASIWDRANILEAERAKAERKAKREARRKGMTL